MEAVAYFSLLQLCYDFNMGAKEIINGGLNNLSGASFESNAASKLMIKRLEKDSLVSCQIFLDFIHITNGDANVIESKNYKNRFNKI